MKRLLLSFVFVAVTLSANAFGYERAREQALFLTDKMAYELNLTQEQYDLAYQINLDYFMSVSSQRDLFGMYWEYRNSDLRYVLYDWQYSLYCSLDYFFQPLRWVRSSWYFPIYSRYSRTHFFFGRPGVYGTYRGGWRVHGSRSISPYASHRPHGGRGLRDHHYPGARPGGRPQGHGNGFYNGNGNRRDNGYRDGRRNDGQHNGGFRPNTQGNNHFGQGDRNGRSDRQGWNSQSQGGQRGQGNFDGQRRDNGRGQGSIGGQDRGGQRGQGSFSGNSNSGSRGQSGFSGNSNPGNRGSFSNGNSGRRNNNASVSSGGSHSQQGPARSGRAAGRSYGR